MNKVILIGRVGNDPEIRETANGSVSNFSVATTESWKDKNTEEWKEKTEWHKVVQWREATVLKGDLVAVEGKIATRVYEPDEGEKKYFTEVVAQSVRRLSRREDSAGASTEGYEKNDESPF